MIRIKIEAKRLKRNKHIHKKWENERKKAKNKAKTAKKSEEVKKITDTRPNNARTKSQVINGKTRSKEKVKLKVTTPKCETRQKKKNESILF